ncbi:unnamed protein product, partial [marine sediment metagenome]
YVVSGGFFMSIEWMLWAGIILFIIAIIEVVAMLICSDR